MTDLEEVWWRIDLKKIGVPLFVAFLTLAVDVQAAGASPDVAEAQRLLNKLGHDPGAIDGQWGRATRSALKAFYSVEGRSFEGSFDEGELVDLRTAAERAGVSAKPIAGVEIENSQHNFLFPDRDFGVIAKRYSLHLPGVVADFNNDGNADVLYVGSMVVSKFDRTATTQGGACGGDRCQGTMAHPTLFVSQPDGSFVHEEDLFVDRRDQPGQSLARQLLVADYNGDQVLDVFIADHGYGTHEGFRDSYFLSQTDGTWLESSETHLSKPNFVVFDHGAATGDIDNDGDMDVVITTLDGRIDCWMNSGNGQLRHVRGCARDVRAFAIELGDLDDDGDLDLVVGGDDSQGPQTPISIIYNNGFGNSPSRSVCRR